MKNWLSEITKTWDRFWFTCREPHTLGLIRILAGAMLFYTHFVWGLRLMDFMGPDAWIPSELSQQMQGNQYVWSFLWYVDSPNALWTIHILGLAVIGAFTVGFQTRITSVLAWFIALMYCHRLAGSLFGLDQINVMLTMYLMLAPCGSVYSIDAWRKGLSPSDAPATISTNVATRLIQLHMCVIYLFGGIGKLRGVAWWDGSAVWMSVANYEYQSLDMTWLAHYPLLIAFMTHVTVFWETFYCVLVWNRLTRPIMLFLAFAVHGGIALFLGMITFGLAMIFGNMAFIEPARVEQVRQWFVRREEAPKVAVAGS